jgi:muramoyltetrapeptide carboxypeptidase LdcA involved in peptidoglycan recycling
MNFKTLNKLQAGDKVAILSPSFGAPAKWPQVYELGLKRLSEVFGLVPVEFPATKLAEASKEARSQDLIAAFNNPEIKAVIAAIGGDDQITYVYDLPKEPFINNPKPYFGYSDNSQFINFLWQCGVPAFYGGNLFTEFAMQVQMDEFTVKYLKHALFDSGKMELTASSEFNDIGLNWNDPATLSQRRRYQPNEGWYWDGNNSATGITWGGCLESIDEMLRHGKPIPTLEEFENIVMFTETSEEVPNAYYVWRVFRGLGERGILKRVRGLIVGRPKAWEFDKQNSDAEKVIHKQEQRNMILKTFREYNKTAPVIQNFDIGHTSPQIQLPTGKIITIESSTKKIYSEY